VAFYPKYPINTQSSLEDFGGEVFRPVKMRRSEIVEPSRGVSVLSFADVSFDDCCEFWILKEVSGDTVNAEAQRESRKMTWRRLEAASNPVLSLVVRAGPDFHSNSASVHPCP